MREGREKTEWYGRITIERIARETGVSEQDVEKVLEELSDGRVAILKPTRAITWRTIVKLGLWLVGILFAFILLAVLIVAIVGR